MGSILDLEFITNRNLNSLSRELVTLVALMFRILIWNFGHANSSLSRELVTLVALIFRILIWNFGHLSTLTTPSLPTHPSVPGKPGEVRKRFAPKEVRRFSFEPAEAEDHYETSCTP